MIDVNEKKMQKMNQYLTSIFHTCPAIKPRLPFLKAIALFGSMLSGVLITDIAAADTAAVGTIYSGTLEPGDEIFAYDGSFYDGYPVQGNLGRRLAVTLQSDEFDPFVAIVGPNGEWLAQNDDISSNDNTSELLFVFPNNDIYYVFVNAYSVNGHGNYTLSLSVEPTDSTVSVPLDAPSMPPPILINSSNSSTDTSDSAVGSSVSALPESPITVSSNANSSEATPSTLQDSSSLIAEGLSTTLTAGEQQILLETHNQYRTEVDISDLLWSDAIATSAQAWADHLAITNAFYHGDSDYGENLWTGTANGFALTEMVTAWGEEKEYFMPNRPFPNVSTTGNWADVGHYTQIVWENTTAVGCGLASTSSRDILVCQYDPPGNFQGEMPF